MSITTTSDRLEVFHDPTAENGPQGDGASTDQPGEQGAGVTPEKASTRPTFTITDAATSCSVSRKTITRKLPELAVHGAAKDEDGVWRIPVEALLGVGLHPGRSLPEAPTGARPAAPEPLPVRPPEHDTVTIPRDRWDDVRIRLARAEAEAAERGLALADARLALRALTAGPVTALRAPEPVAGQDPTLHVSRRDTIPEVASNGEAPRAENAPRGGTAARLTAGKGENLAVAPSNDATTLGASTPTMEMSAPGEGPDAGPVDVVAARNLAARTGGYVPAGATPMKKRRWWQSR
jgi:hypothetical protein